MFKKYLFLIILGLLTFSALSISTTSVAFANQELPGIISGDTLLKAENTPYDCTNNLIINQNAALSLEPNVTLNVNGSLVIQGKLNINQDGKVLVKGNLYRQPGDSSIDEYINNQKLIVSGRVFNFSTTSSPEIKDTLPTNPTSSKTPQISANFIDAKSQIDINTLIVLLDGKDITSEISIKDNKHFSYIPSLPLNIGTHKVQVFISNIDGLTSNKEWSFKVSNPPKFNSYSPSPTSTTKRPTITASFSDESGINRINVFFDGKDVSSKIIVRGNQFTYVPSADLKYGKHYVQVTITNNDGLTSILKWSFLLTDPKPPVLKIISPYANRIIYNRRPTIAFSAVDYESGINLRTLVVLLDNKKMTVKSNKQGFYSLPNYPLSTGKHSVIINIKDNSGHQASKSWSFTVATPGFAPGSNELWIEVNQKTQRVYIMKGTKVTREIICSSGMPNTPTPNGIFRIQNRGTWFLAKSKVVGAKYWVSFKGYGEYMFHSILFDKKGKYIIGSSVRKLGSKASHGCIRLPLSEAIWIYKNIPTNTRVVIFDK